MASSGKFDGVDFWQIDIESLTSELPQLGQGLRCVRGEFVTYWKQGQIQRQANAYLEKVKNFQTLVRMAGKIKAVAYNIRSGDICFRSLLTPHSARTTVRAVPFIQGVEPGIATAKAVRTFLIPETLLSLAPSP
jgi:hypothetical protein